MDLNEKEEQTLLKTINIPKNLLFLSNQLPKPNYNEKTKIDSKIGDKNYSHVKSRKTKLPKLNINTKFNEESKNFLSIPLIETKQNSVENEYKNDANNNLDEKNNNNNIIFDIKNEVQFYKKLHVINQKPNKYSKLYKLYDPNMKLNEVKKMPKYKILTSLRNNNKKINLFWKNREELYKDLCKNIDIKSELYQILNKNTIRFESSEGINNGNYSQGKIEGEYKIYRSKNKLSPISFKKDFI